MALRHLLYNLIPSVAGKHIICLYSRPVNRMLFDGTFRTAETQAGWMHWGYIIISALAEFRKSESRLWYMGFS